MATDYQDVLDSQKVYDGQQSFIGGVNSFDSPELIAQNAISYGENVDVSFDGKIKSRPGTQLVASGISGAGVFADYYAISGGNGDPTGRVLAITPFNPKKLDGNTNYVYVASSGDPGQTPARLRFAVWEGSSWTTARTAVLTNTQPVALDFLPFNNTLYAVFGAGLYKLSTEAGQTPTFVKTTPVLAAPNVAMPNCQYGCVHRERIVGWANTDFAASDQDIFFSNVLDPETFDIVNFTIQAGTIDEGPVVACINWFSNNLLIFKQRAVYVVDTTDPSSANWPIQLITRSQGCVARNSVKVVGNDVWFLGADGVYSIGRVYALENQGQISPPISRPIKDVFANFILQGIAATQLSYAVALGTKYILSFPSTSLTRCDTTIVFNLISNVWDGIYTFGGYNPQCYGKVGNGMFVGINHASTDAHPNFPNVWAAPGQYVSGSTTDYVAQDQPNSYTAATNFTWKLKSRSSDFGSSTSPKKGSHAFFWADTVNAVTNVVHSTIVDGSVRDTIQTVTIPTTGQARKIADLQQFDRFFALQHQLTGTGPVSFKAVGSAAWLEATPREL